MIQRIAFNFFGTAALFACFFVGCSTAEIPQPSVIEVVCDECDGDGQVTYGPDHPIVKMGFDPGEYECPICGGTGRLYEDRR